MSKATNKNSVARMQQRVAAVLVQRAAHHAARVTARNLQAYNAQVAALQAQLGITPDMLQARAVHGAATNIAPKHAPSALVNACATVRELAAQHGFNRAATLAAAQALGINPATAATQYAKAKKASVQA